MPLRRLALVVLVCVASCAGAREKALRASYAGVQAAEKVVVTYDHEHKRALLGAATPDAAGRAEFDAQLAAYKERRAIVLASLTSAYSLIAAAALDPKKLTLAEIAAIAVEVEKAVDVFRGGGP